MVPSALSSRLRWSASMGAIACYFALHREAEPPEIDGAARPAQRELEGVRGRRVWQARAAGRGQCRLCEGVGPPACPITGIAKGDGDAPPRRGIEAALIGPVHDVARGGSLQAALEVDEPGKGG
jgi:hypothetical protein